MSRLSTPRPSTAIALVASTVAVLAVTFPGLGFGETNSVHGGSPSDVYMAQNPGFCATVDGFGGSVIQQEITLDASSNLLAYFTFEWGNLSQKREGLVDIALLASDGSVVGDSNEWGNGGSTTIPRASSTVMWMFGDVAPGTYTVHGAARVDVIGQPPAGVSGGIEECALTVLVIPHA